MLYETAIKRSETMSIELADTIDQECLVAGMKIARDVVHTKEIGRAHV